MSKPRLHASTEAVLKTIMDTSRGTGTIGYMHKALLFGMKVGAYLALRRVDLMTGCLSHEEIYCLGGTTEDILDKVEKYAGTKGVDIESVLKEKLASAILGRHEAERHLAEAKEALKNADIREKVAYSEVNTLERLLKELVP
jgi:hypothetical protein